MTTTQTKAYPKEVTLLRSSQHMTIRPLAWGDANALLAFFLRVPEEDRFYLKEDVTSPEVINDWVHHRNYDRVFPIVALVEGKIVADATLHRRRAGARRHIGEVRIVVDPEYRNQGLGTLMIRDLIDFAYDNGLEKVIFELVEGKEDNAIKVAERLGFSTRATLPNHVKDLDGNPHDLAIMELSMDVWPDWWVF